MGRDERHRLRGSSNTRPHEASCCASRRVPDKLPGRRSVSPGQTGSQAALELATSLDATTLPIQGPPGSGKTYSGARMILKLIGAGRQVGIAANSHKVITNLLDAVAAAAEEAGVTVRGMQKVDGEDGCKHAFVECVNDNGRVAEALAARDVDVVGGTAWLWSRDEMTGIIDTLFVDEAGQMSLANVVAMSGAPATSCSLVIRSSSSSRSRACILMARERLRSATCSAKWRPCRRIAACSSSGRGA